MNYESYTKTYYSIKKKNKRTDYILTLTKFTNNTKEMSTPLSPMSWYESWDDGLQKDTLINSKTGEVILMWNRDYVTYINDEYEVHITQEHKTINDKKLIEQHNQYIEHRTKTTEQKALKINKEVRTILGDQFNKNGQLIKEKKFRSLDERPSYDDWNKEDLIRTLREIEIYLSTRQ